MLVFIVVNLFVLVELDAILHSVNFTYNGEGLLTGKTVAASSVYHNYIYENGKLIRQTLNGSVLGKNTYNKVLRSG